MLDPRPTAPSRRAWAVAALSATLALGAAACGPPTPPPEDGGNRDATPEAAPPMPIVHLNVDSNRDGVVESTEADRAHRAEWSTMHGAMFLANVDDDDSNQAIDSSDTEVTGAEDENDLARIRVEASPGTPMTATGAITLEGVPEMGVAVHLFKHNADGTWALFTPGTDTLTGAELRAGVEFGIESDSFPTRTWNGSVTLTLTVTDGATMVGTDQVAMRVAPWVFDNVLGNTERTFASNAFGYPASDVFIRELTTAMETDMVPLTVIDAWREEYQRRPPNDGPDLWTQDIMEFGWTGIAGPNGMMRTMHVVMRAATPDRPATSYTMHELLGPDMGVVWPHTYTRTPALGGAYDPSLDSTGNTEMIPPYANGDQNYPLGRIVLGYTTARRGDNAVLNFFDAQQVQGPSLRVDTSWLLVGHTDECISFVPATGTRHGWKLLIASPRVARENLQALVTANPANGEQLVFRGKFWTVFNPDGTARRVSAQRTVNDILNDADLMAFNQQIQARIDVWRMQIVQATGIPDADIVEIPFLHWAEDEGRAGAYQVGTVNLLSYNTPMGERRVVMGRPHGPMIDGADPVQTDLVTRMMPLSIRPHFVEQWDVQHASLGEVHCGTNAIRTIPTTPRWWEVAR